MQASNTIRGGDPPHSPAFKNRLKAQVRYSGSLLGCPKLISEFIVFPVIDQHTLAQVGFRIDLLLKLGDQTTRFKPINR
jgi:hypothetical protein